MVFAVGARQRGQQFRHQRLVGQGLRRGEHRAQLPWRFVADPAQKLGAAGVHQLARGRDRQQRRIDGFALQGGGGIRQRLQRQHLHVRELETVFVGEQSQRIVEAGADLGDRDALAREILWRLQAGGIGVVAGEIADQGIAGFFAAHAADHFQRALAREIIETGGERGDAEIDVARRGRDRNRLRGVEEFQFDIESGLTEIALVLRDEHRRRRRQPEHADLGFQRVFGAGGRGDASARQQPIPSCNFLRIRYCEPCSVTATFIPFLRAPYSPIRGTAGPAR